MDDWPDLQPPDERTALEQVLDLVARPAGHLDRLFDAARGGPPA